MAALVSYFIIFYCFNAIYALRSATSLKVLPSYLASPYGGRAILSCS